MGKVSQFGYPILVIGDFNVVLSAEEKLDGIVR